MSFWICVKAFEYEALDRYMSSIRTQAINEGYTIRGPINFPNKLRKITVLKSPHVNKQSREQFEIRTHCRVLGVLSEKTSQLETFINDLKETFPVGFSLKVTRKIKGK